MAWKSSFRQNYQTTFSPTVPTSAAGISHVVADVKAPGGEKWEHLKTGGKQWQTALKNLPRMQRTRAKTSRLTELWSLPRPAQGQNTNNNNNNNNNNKSALVGNKTKWIKMHRETVIILNSNIFPCIWPKLYTCCLSPPLLLQYPPNVSTIRPILFICIHYSWE